MKKIFLIFSFFMIIGCEVIDDIFGGDKSTCQCELELTFTDMPFELDGEIVTYEDVTTNVNSGQLSCEEYFNNPPTNIEFTGSVVVDYNNNLGFTIVETFSKRVSDIPEWDIKNAKCVGDIISD